MRVGAAAALVLVVGVLLVPISPAEASVTALLTLGTLSVTGDGADDTITLRVVAGDSTRIEVLDGTTVVGGFPRSGFGSILVRGLGGNDTILLSRVNGEITEFATLEGGAGNDILTGGAGNHILSGGSENDQMHWNPGDGTALVEGGAGADSLDINGADEAETFGVTANGTRVRFDRNATSTTGIAIDIGTTEGLILEANGGNDIVTCTGNLAALISLIIDSGDGDDTLIGSNGADIILAGDGSDTITPGQGADQILAGEGDDLVVWSPGDSNDTVEGQSGTDTLLFNGNSAIEVFEISPSGGRVRLTRNVANIVMDLDDVEVIEILAMAGTDVLRVAASLAATDVTSLILDGGDGNDVIAGSDLDDILRGGAGDDTIAGGAGNDTIVPGPGNETLVQGGPGNDTLIWNVGDDRDVFDGQDGQDTLVFNGSGLDEVIWIQSTPTDVEVRREVGPTAFEVLHLRTTEAFEINSLGGNDTVNVVANPGPVTGVVVDLGVGADTLNTFGPSVVNVNGNTEIDTLNIDAMRQLVSTTPSTIAIGGVTRVTHAHVEHVAFTNLLNAPPTISIASPPANPTTATTPFITLAGSAADETGVASVTWVSNRGGSGAATGTTDWTVPDVSLVAGVNVITVTAVDTSGNQASDVRTVTVNVLSYTMAEGATGGFFDTDILLANPNSVVAPVTITYLKGDGTTVTQSFDLPATSRTTIAVDGIAGLENAEVSSTVTSTNALPLIVERTMRWDATGYGAHTERATDAPATTWYFAEGSQGFFQTYVLLANPGSSSNSATITFLLESGAPVAKTFTLTPTSRRTIATDAIPELTNQSFGIVVTFTHPGVAERAMYFGTPVFNAGHESAGVNAMSTRWFLAEGATGSFFTTFVLLTNPGGSDATATVTFLPATGLPVTKTHVVPAGRRVTLNIAAEDASLLDSAVATQVVSTAPILVERAQYWPFTPDRWYEAHNSFGGTALGTKWGLAEGRVGGPERYQTYILLANASPTQAARATITFLRANGTTLTKTFAVSPTSRFNVHVNSMAPELSNESFGAVVEVTSGPGIFVERALYADSQGVVFAAGTNALATRLP